MHNLLSIRFGPKGKEAHLSCLIIYYFVVFIVIIAVFVIGMFYFYSNNFIRETVESVGEDLADNLAIWLEINIGSTTLIDILGGNSSVVVILVTLISALFLSALGVCGYLIGYELFIKANLSFGSIFVFLAGVAIAIISMLFRNQLNLGGDFSFFYLILFSVGIVIGIVGVGGCVCGLMPKKCYIPLHIFALLLIIIMGVLAVFGIIVLLFPAMFWQPLVDSISESCADVNTTSCLIIIII